jgi:hypothetical protein
MAVGRDAASPGLCHPERSESREAGKLQSKNPYRRGEAFGDAPSVSPPDRETVPPRSRSDLG